jgi:circadian clock protein KaiB
MSKRNHSAAARRKGAKTPAYSFRLYVTGATPRSTKAIKNLKKLCDEHLAGKYELHVVDIYQQPALARGQQIIAAPTLIKEFPLPLQRFIGDLSNTERMFVDIVNSEASPTDGKPGSSER